MLATAQPAVPTCDTPALSEVLAIDIPRTAEVLNLSAKTVRRHIKSGKLPFVRIGGRIRVPVDGLRKMLNGEK